MSSAEEKTGGESTTSSNEEDEEEQIEALLTQAATLVNKDAGTSRIELTKQVNELKRTMRLLTDNLRDQHAKLKHARKMAQLQK